MLLGCNKLDLRIAIKTGIAASCSYFIAREYVSFFARPDSLISGLWCVITTIVVMQANVGSTYKVSVIRLLGVAIGSLLGGISTHYFGASLLGLGMCVTIATFVCSLFQLKEAYRIAALSVAVVMLSWAVHPEASPWVISFFRSFDSTVGILVAIFVSHIIWPDQTWANINAQFLKALQMAKLCYHEAVKTAASKNYGDELSELIGLLAKLHQEVDDTKLDFFTFGEERERWVIAVQALDSLVESIAVLGQIPKAHLVNIFDESLRVHLEAFIETVQNAFEGLQSQCMAGATLDYKEPLQAQEKLLTADLERFRGTHQTRNFAIADVESLYSFFYQLRHIAQQLHQIGAKLPTKEREVN
jgi:hypothetical protein